LLDDAGRLVPVHAVASDGRAVDHKLLGAEGLPRSVMERREPAYLEDDALGESPPKLDLGIGKAPLRWVLAHPVALGAEGAGAIVLGGIHRPTADGADFLSDASRQLSAALHNAWTHDRLRDKSTALQEQGERLTRASQVKTEFLASMSHELRTPLSAILGFADLLLTSPKEQLSPRARESLERIKRNGDHLLGLISDVIDLAKAETGRVDVRLAPVNVALLARACFAEVESLRKDKDIRMALEVGEVPVETVTDAQRVRQILVNLLGNALKFTDRGEVTLALRVTPTDVRLAVRDTGIGIPAAAIGELFQDFHQLEAGDGRRFAGTGVGLALSRRLARALGGEIEVRSHEGQGSTFTLVLPYAPPRVAGEAATGEAVTAAPADSAHGAVS
jgi:signal transduction histidine kinase